MSLQQVGPDVVATGTGILDLTGLTFDDSLPTSGTGLRPGSPTSGPLVGLGPIPGANANRYFSTPFSGPANFGPGTTFDPAGGGAGDLVVIEPNFGAGPIGLLWVPAGYVSGNPLSDRMTFNNQTFTSLGVTPGTYEWSWGLGTNQNFTLDIPAAGVPDPVQVLGYCLSA